MREGIDQGDVIGLIAAFQTIKNQAEQLLVESKKIREAILLSREVNVSVAGLEYSMNGNERQIKGLISEFNKFVDNYCKLLTDKKQEDLLLLKESGESACGKIIIRCEFINKNLEEEVSPITPAQRNKVRDLRDLLNKLSSEINNPVLEGNISVAMDEYEAGHALASWLISGRVVNYLIEQIPIDDKSNKDKTSERIRYLKKIGIIDDKDRDTTELLMRSARESRQVGSHQIGISPSIVADAQSLLADSIRILERVSIKLPKHESTHP